jgi:hypothetical protein
MGLKALWHKRQPWSVPVASPVQPAQKTVGRMARMPADVPRNLVWHFYPVPHVWQWHADKLRELLSSGAFDGGRVIIGISTDGTTDTAQEVQDRIGISGIDWILTDNINHDAAPFASGQRFGELQTAIPAMEMLRGVGESVTFYGHAKGVRPHTKTSEAVRVWSEMMYETVMFNADFCVDKISEGYDFVGSFVTGNCPQFRTRYSWHYSGTYYAFRTRRMVSERLVLPYQLVYGGTEMWPGNHVARQDAYCVFADRSPCVRQYDIRQMIRVTGQNIFWESSRFGGGPHIDQHYREFLWLMNEISGMGRGLIIGSNHGGLEHHILSRGYAGEIVSVDIAPKPTNTAPRLIIGDSMSETVQQQVRDCGPYDWVFIDGDHSEHGARKDFEFAISLSPRKIFFHDILKSSFHLHHGCLVDIVWADVKKSASSFGWSVREKVVGCGWGGIGAVELR